MAIRFTKGLVGVVSVAALVLSLGACNSGDDDDGTGGTGGGTGGSGGSAGTGGTGGGGTGGTGGTGATGGTGGTGGACSADPCTTNEECPENAEGQACVDFGGSGICGFPVDSEDQCLEGEVAVPDPAGGSTFVCLPADCAAE